ncbi:MAG: hypothetical protein AVDCRST_MAG53-2672 [uncultured Solirubrobacteraceae bacterium]|uniref:Uncharacterized protein n=1 Tax=uncultured Solirubrobacteraceae bacterium TaxID=1162706 RepID=A0A6J4T2A6_9ACTN|nr:MAG: hypothetical protein AVDCRST_MAG53-2672 [uncultured Solirubrobacteraceae bacterium]
MGAIERTPRDVELLGLANRQHGVLRAAQLAEHGLTRRMIAQRTRSGRLTRLHHGVFTWGHSALTREGRWLAALWACGAGAVLSHTTAAACHRIGGEHGTDVHVSTTRRSVHSRDGIVVHRVSSLHRADVQRTRGLWVTRIPRTVVDLADATGWAEVRGAVDALRWFSPAELRAAQRRAPGRAGRGLVVRLLEADEAHTKSELERRFLRFVRRHSLPRPTGLNVQVAGFKADCCYAAERLVVELDGRAYHQRRRQMEADRLRDEGYQLAGHRIQRFLWDDFHAAQEARTAERLVKMLGRRVP